MIDLKTQFGNKAAGNAAAAGTDAPKAQFWLNFGFVAQGTGNEAEGKPDAFVSLPAGLPLDTMERVKTNSSNAEFAQLQAARNDLYDQIMALAKELKPGEDRVIMLDVQIRRVKDEQPVSAGADNKFARQLSFA